MKLIFSYIEVENSVHGSYMRRDIHIESINNEVCNVRHARMLSRYISDLNIHPTVIDWVFDGIYKVETGLSISEERSGEYHRAIYAKDSVVIDCTLADDNDPEWPKETFTIAEVKIALEGWKRFLEMPESLDSVVEVYI